MNKWEEVLKIINWVQGTNIQMGEEFDVPYSSLNPYKMTDDGLVDVDLYKTTFIWVRLITGEIKIKNRPWVPKEGDTLFYPAPYFKSLFDTITYGEASPLSKTLIEHGIHCRTKAEAIEMSKKMLGVVDHE